MSHPDDAGDGFTRRSLLRGLAVSLPVIVTGCRMTLEGDVAVDAGATADSAGTGAVLCGPNLCVDLMNPVNAQLNTVGGSRIFVITGDRVIVVRTSQTEFSTLSDVCTHNGCGVRYVVGSNSFACPCHGSKFAIDGSVNMGPATRPLKVYANTFDSATSTVTVMLG
jgi:Rieske Fe-S protein